MPDGTCREEVFWVFPFVGMAIVFLIVIGIAECIWKQDSNFKESLIAFWSLLEVFAWATFIYLVYDRTGELNLTLYLAALACLFYVCLNTVHAIWHPRYMVPTALYSYKQLLTNYKCGTFIARAISYIITFKFSLILVSSLCGSKRLKGDYSAMNWKHFNRFSLVFIITSWPAMMGSCAYFIVSDGFWSYPGFVAAETITLSSLMAMLLAMDAISAIKCKTVGK